jgi:hypothetical protein
LKFGRMYQRVVLSMCSRAKVGRKIVKYGIDYETLFQRRYRMRSLCFVVCEDSGIDGIKSLGRGQGVEKLNLLTITRFSRMYQI